MSGPYPQPEESIRPDNPTPAPPETPYEMFRIWPDGTIGLSPKFREELIFLLKDLLGEAFGLLLERHYE